MDLYSFRSREAFSLLELVVVIAIIVAVMSMLISGANLLRNRSKYITTQDRIQSILSSLADYEADSGQVAVALQTYANLGGPLSFSNLEAIHNHNLTVGGSADPTFLAVTGGYGLMWGTDYWSSHLNQDYWDRCMDVMPPPGQQTQAGWYEQIWPFQWPDSTWLSGNGPNSTAPPILRYPWGRPGLRLDGTLCDPAALPTNVINQVIEFKDANDFMANNYGNPAVYNSIPVPNCMVVNGNPSNASPYTWNTPDATQSSAAGATVAGMRSDQITTVVTTANMPMPFDLGYLSPLHTIDLLQAIGVLPPGQQGIDAYCSDRTVTQPWNDAWGNPLIVSYALFIPERYHRTYDVENRRDLLLRSALIAYSYNRAVYLSAGALGPVLDSGISTQSLSSDPSSLGYNPFLRSAWMQICRLCKAQTWTEQSFDNPPWKGITVGSASGQTSFLSAPTTVH